MAETKSFLKSKTVWIQTLAVLSMFIPAVAAWVAANPVEFVAALAAVNTLVRFVTSGKVTLFSDDDDTSGNGSAQGVGALGGKPGTAHDKGSSWFSPSRRPAFPWLVVAACAVVFLFPSCTPAQIEAARAVPIVIGIEGEHGSYGYSSKGGLSVSVKVPRVREEKSAPDFGRILEREWGEGRYEPGPLEQWPPIERKPRRLVVP